MSQCTDILKHLRTHGSIGFFDSLRLYGCKHLGARILDLRQAGHDIRTVKHDGVKWVRYELPLPEQEEMW